MSTRVSDAARHVALHVISELEWRAEDTLASYQNHPDGECDFVWVEEGVSARLEELGLGQREYEATAGLVFAWLTAAHGVQPPRWWRRWQAGEPDAAWGVGTE